MFEVIRSVHVVRHLNFIAVLGSGENVSEVWSTYVRMGEASDGGDVCLEMRRGLERVVASVP
jgi:hypothetical protein